MENIGIYLHIPFCKRKCFYCHFVKYEYENLVVEKYTHSLINELELRSNSDYIIDTIYIGGGSPSILTEKQIFIILNSISKYYKVKKYCECTMEMNPEDINLEMLKNIKELGVNRVSIGTQSFIPEDLKYLKRNHKIHQAIKSIENAAKIGFSNINLDFIIGLPTQTAKTLARNFHILKEFDLPHVSTYLLEGIKKYSHQHEKDHQLYFFTKEFLENMGYIQYEVSNFCKNGYQCQHNLKYWENKNYIGAGLSASGFEKGIDYKNTNRLKIYSEILDQSQLPVEEKNTFDPNFRRMVMGLRLTKGLPISHFKGNEEQVGLLLSEGFLNQIDNRIAIKPSKILLLNEILNYFRKAP